jgi:hypothetical protein
MSLDTQTTPPTPPRPKEQATGQLVLVHGDVPPVIAAAAFANCCSLAKSWGPLRIREKCNAIMVFSLAQLKLTALNSLMPKGSAHKVVSLCPINAVDLQVATPEGAQVFQSEYARLAKTVSPTDMLFVDLALPTRFDGNSAIHFSAAIGTLASTKSVVVLFVRDKKYIDELAVFCNTADIIHVEKLIPDHDAAVTIKFSTEEASPMWIASPSPKLMSLLKERTGAIWRREPHFHDDPDARYLVRLRHQEKTLEQIAEILGVDKSTVKRRLDKLRPIAPKT